MESVTWLSQISARKVPKLNKTNGIFQIKNIDLKYNSFTLALPKWANGLAKTNGVSKTHHQV